VLLFLPLLQRAVDQFGDDAVAKERDALPMLFVHVRLQVTSPGESRLTLFV
jgi:hypothetical protein